ncbi:S-layer homology domain-containing protein [Thermotalea metallivorans]|uniref:Endoglucanase n=1 Tax=Thermotalea metallivorans TaxID=520762 RepID=A0A140L6E9_9FIRM|nr:S-layer homology domain-containing protein [Thermotalea metallivorans]KXG76124.1 Endoglucanase [Thermotalea metallivorans]
MKKIISLILTMGLLFTMGIPSYAAEYKGFTPPGLAKKGGLPPGIAKKFMDLDGFDWAREAIEKLAHKGIISGVAEGQFAPSRHVTKIEALAMIIRAMGWDDAADLSLDLIKKGKKEDKIKDKLQDWTKGYMEVAREKGLIDEIDLAQQNFATPATRQEVAKYIIRALGLEEEAQQRMNEKLRFKDTSAVQIGAVGYVYLIDAKDIMKGYPDGTFRPNQPVRRAEMASLVAILDEQLDDGEDEAQGVQTIKGKLIWVHDEKIFIERNKDIEGYKLGNDIKVYIHGKMKTIKDLKIGEIIEIKIEDKIVQEIWWKTDVVVIEESFQGIITDINIDDQKIVVKNENKEKLFTIEKGTEIKMDGKTKSFHDLAVGMKIELKLENGKVTKVTAATTAETFKGIIIEKITGKENKLTLQAGNQMKTFAVAKNAEIKEKDGDILSFDELKVGKEVQVKVENYMIVKIYTQD